MLKKIEGAYKGLSRGEMVDFLPKWFLAGWPLSWAWGRAGSQCVSVGCVEGWCGKTEQHKEAEGRILRDRSDMFTELQRLQNRRGRGKQNKEMEAFFSFLEEERLAGAFQKLYSSETKQEV